MLPEYRLKGVLLEYRELEAWKKKFFDDTAVSNYEYITPQRPQTRYCNTLNTHNYLFGHLFV
jgi:hypothetical protein